MLDYVGEALGLSAEEEPDLEEMNARFAVVNVGGKTRVCQLVESHIYPGCIVPEFSTLNDFRAFHSNRKKTIVNKNGIREVGLGTWWLDQPDRCQYDGVVYTPNVDDHNVLNLWRGFACKPIQGDCGLYIDHLYD